MSVIVYHKILWTGPKGFFDGRGRQFLRLLLYNVGRSLGITPGVEGIYGFGSLR